VEMGLIGACGFFIYRMSSLFRISPSVPREGEALPPGVQAFELYGALFFGAAAKLESLPDQVGADTRALVLDMHRLISMDTSGLEALEQLHTALQRRSVALVLAEVNEQPLGLIRRSGFATHLGEEHIVPKVADALQTDAIH